MKSFEYFCNLNSLFKKSDEKKNSIFASFGASLLNANQCVGTDEMELRLSAIHRPI